MDNGCKGKAGLRRKVLARQRLMKLRVRACRQRACDALLMPNGHGFGRWSGRARPCSRRLRRRGFRGITGGARSTSSAPHPVKHFIRILDTHTGGEPTRIVLEGGPDLGAGPLADRVARFRETFDAHRSAIANEPRGSDVMVGALIVPPHDPR